MKFYDHTKNCGLLRFLKTLSSIKQKGVACTLHIGIEHTVFNSDPNPTLNPKRPTHTSPATPNPNNGQQSQRQWNQANFNPN